MIVDMHSHILPAIDDGSATIQESIALLQLEAEQGIKHVIATPHFYPHRDTPEIFLKKRARAEMQLREEMAQYTDLPEVSVGAEVYFFSGISNSELLPQLSIAGKRCILIEMPCAPWTNSMLQELEAIYTKQGLIPIVAHVDRYIRPFRTYGIPERLSQLPVMVQANAGFFLRPSTRRMALKMLRSDNIQLLGSDCHNLKDRVPNLGEAIEWIQKKIGSEAIEHIEACQNAILRER